MSADHSPELASVLTRYAALASQADSIFAELSSRFPEAVNCREGCADCCRALFDLPLIEAFSLKQEFELRFTHGPERSAILEEADKADRALQRIKRLAFKAEQAGTPAEQIFAALARERVRCPLLLTDSEGLEYCALYAARPLTCRIYGVPAAIAGKSRTCALSAFAPGTSYPSVKMEALYARLAELSLEFARAYGSGYAEIHKILAPVSLALLTDYDAAYFGKKQP